MAILTSRAFCRAAHAVALAAVLLAPLMATRAVAQERPEQVERQVKAAFLYKFGGYVTWPEGTFQRPDSPVVIAIAGADALADELAKVVAGRTLGERPLTVRRIARPDAASGAHILFVGNGAGARLAEFTDYGRGKPMLVVSESDGQWPPGCVINFVLVENRVRFDVSLAAAEQNGLKLSALLLSVARQVRGR
jgi:hypothetical protein